MSPIPLKPYWTLIAVCLAAMIMPMSFSAGAIATPAIGRDLGGSPLALSWITNAFMLAFGSLLMAAGTLADAYGRKRVFVIGVALFALASLLLGLAPGMLWLDMLRALQGMGGAAALAGGSASLAHAFDGPARTRAFSALGTSFGVGLSFGPILAGWLISHHGWRAVFVSSAVIGAGALALAWRGMQESRDPNAGPLDWAGTLTFTAALALLTWGILQAPGSGWSSVTVLGLLAAALVMLVAFVRVQGRAARPMLDLSLFRYPRFVGVQVLPIATCYCFAVLLVILPLYFIGVQGRSEVDTGLAMLALCAPMLVVPGLAAWLSRFASAGVISGTGLLIAALGLWLLSGLAADASASAWVLPMLVVGVGTGLPWGLMDGLSVSVVPKERAGMATGIFGTVRVAGEGIALAMVMALLSGLIARQLGLADSALGAEAVTLAAQYLAAGDLAHAAQSAPTHALLEAASQAISELARVLMVITLLCAGVVFVFLGERRVQASQGIPRINDI
ncbi:MFS transporter [Pseudomonas abieticivorans]|uniref:MFS transporter n=1 Tax=Pseudomonas abieticivorans TaxID=2931382 RepID=UPI0020BF287A|nr:MFS transporter [Pseudomonas sp. PIA16]